MSLQQAERLSATDITGLLEETGINRYELSIDIAVNDPSIEIPDVNNYDKIVRKLGLDCYKNLNHYREIKLESSSHKGWVFRCEGFRPGSSLAPSKARNIIDRLEKDGFIKGWISSRITQSS
ncbi:hypothetical protein HY450_03845 [Candidatus Pacearchaeota archaeon]|nr:hypothetical protein [Candidatus Pacearchaeota archaeon]